MSKNVTIKNEDLKSLFDNELKKGGRNQYITRCPYCSKERHFYIDADTQLFDCKKCGESGNIITLLQFLDRLDLLEGFKSIEREKIKLLSEYDNERDDDEIEINPKKRKLPFGYKRVKKDKYLTEVRKFSKETIERIPFGRTRLKKRFKDYIIIPIIENGENKGYLARLAWSPKKLKFYENTFNRKKIRYLNDKGAKFSNLLFGYDDIIEGSTKTVILVEGFTDKIKLDQVLNLHSDSEIASIATFGKKISKSQIAKLLIKGVENLILIYDYDAIKEMKKYGKQLSLIFNVELTFTYNKDVDDSTDEEIFDVLGKTNDIHYFDRKFVNKLN